MSKEKLNKRVNMPRERRKSLPKCVPSTETLQKVVIQNIFKNIQNQKKKRKKKHSS